MVFDYFFYGITLLIITLSLLPLIKSPKWYIRVWDYPRFQLFFFSITTIIVFINLIEINHPLQWICFGLLGANILYLFWFIYPYTFLHSKMLPSEKEKNPAYRIKLLTINVYQHNERYDLTLQRIQEVKADVVYLLETDKEWMQAVQPIKKDYPYFIEVPQDNTYGLLFYSKFPMINQSINYWIDETIPSIMVDLKIKDEIVRLYGIHPTPPVPQENPESTERDAEILIVGKKSDEFKGPSIVFGDLNDVAWSHTTRLFLRISKMLDPRIGRGMFNTFHAKYWFTRWPLDHFFVSSHFRLIDMKVEKSVQSDHFPISIDLSIQFELKEKELEATKEDKEEAQEIIQEARN
jgi:endonuclease/exonuclease/phosphatase (EEP) superfamily protein YafD